MSPPNDNIILLTGATGHVGFRVLLTALSHDYHVLAAVRSQSKADLIASNPALKAHPNAGHVRFTIIPDFLAPGAFDDAVQTKGLTNIIHVASPIATSDPPDGDYNKYFIQPAVRGTLAVLESAAKNPAIKKVVITSSIVAITSVTFGAEKPGHIWKPTDRHPGDNGPYANSFHAYASSKIAALNATDKWVQDSKPNFDVVNIFPGFIFGRDELCDSTQYFQTGTNQFVVNIPLGHATKEMTFGVSYAHVNDVADAHVLALAKPGEGYILTNSGEQYEEFADIGKLVEREYPTYVEKGVFKVGEAWGSAPFKADVSATESLLGRKMASLEEVTKSVMDHYVELFEKEKGKN